MRVCVIGAGALGGSYGARLALSGVDVTLIDVLADHVAAINRDGLRLDGVPGAHTVAMAAYADPAEAPPADLAIVTVDANHSADAAMTAAQVLAPDGFALTLQNGIGNVEALVEVLGAARVLGGSSMSSFMVRGPGQVTQTHQGPTTIGELDGRSTDRAATVKAMLDAAGFPTSISPDIMAVIWQKFLLNIAINPICAATGLRLGELARQPDVNDFQDRIIDEALAVVAAKGLDIPDKDIRSTIKRHCWTKFSRPSMQQHVDAGRRTEINALNGALVREAEALGIDVPYNRALTALVKGREFARIRAVHEPDIDYEALEAQAGPWPGDG